MRLCKRGLHDLDDPEHGRLRRDGRAWYCWTCERERRQRPEVKSRERKWAQEYHQRPEVRKQRREWRLRNAERTKPLRRQWRLRNAERLKAMRAGGNQKRKDADPRAIRATRNGGLCLAGLHDLNEWSETEQRWTNRPLKAQWRTECRPCMLERQRQRFATDFDFRLHETLRIRLAAQIRGALRHQGAKKCARSEALLGCTTHEFRAHLEAQFTADMTWANYGSGWHVDHIIPCAAFDLTDDEQQRKCFHFTNLRPLWGAENIAKSDKLPDGRRGRDVRSGR